MSFSTRTPTDIGAVTIFDIVCDQSEIWPTFDIHFRSKYAGSLAIIFEVEADNKEELSTDVAMYLLQIRDQLRSNDLQPSLIALSYTFKLWAAHGIALFDGSFKGWCDTLRSCGAIEIYGEGEIPFVTWPIFNDTLANDVPLALDIARYVM